ncbi:MAG: DNA-processing protein DprA [Clostridia bacterium]
MEYDQMEQYWIWLSAALGAAPKRFYQLIERFGDARAVWDNSADAAQMLPDKQAESLREARTTQNFYALFATLEKLNMCAVTRLSGHYPSALTTIYDPPATLFVRGGLGLSDEKMLGVVGSRRASQDGRRAAEEISRDLAQAGVTIVSGLARGADSCAHKGALDAKGKTIAVLGCGADVVYPPENDKLLARMLENDGSVVSEYPPGTPPYATNFPARNRIISGLSRGVLLIEGKKNSGAMITVNFALEQSREVFAVPGSIYSLLSEAPNQLIFDGALPVRGAWDILENLGWGQRPGEKDDPAPMEALDEDEQKIVEPLKIEALSFDELVNLTGFNPAKLNSHLTILELRGIIRQSSGRMYRA